MIEGLEKLLMLWKNILKINSDVRAIGFCASMEHAKFMAEKFFISRI
jgi:hypothetical protein